MPNTEECWCLYRVLVIEGPAVALSGPAVRPVWTLSLVRDSIEAVGHYQLGCK